MQFNPKHAIIPTIVAIYLTMLLGYVHNTPQQTLRPVTQAAQLKSAAPDTPPQGVAITYTQATLKQKAKRWLLQRIHKAEWLCIKEVIYRESRWIPNLWNSQGSSAYGLGQVKGSYHYTKNKPMKQFKVAVRVAIHKHGTLCNTLKHHNQYGWW